MKQRLYSVHQPAAWQPPQGDGTVLTKTQSRAVVDYDTYVLRYAATQRANTLLAVAGAVLSVAAAVYLDGPALIMAVAVGIGAAIAGGVGFVTAWSAHDEYRAMAVGITETYTRPQPSAPATVRPFVASQNGAKTTNTGRLNFTPSVWRDLFDNALGNGGAVTRDGVKTMLPRRWYYGEGYTQLLEELRRIGFIDGRNRLTDKALMWYEQQIALPLDALPLRPRTGRTDERTDGADGDTAGWGE